MQRNLDRTTLKFLVKTDLYRTVSRAIVREILIGSALISSRQLQNSTKYRES